MAQDRQHLSSIEPIETDAIMASLQISAVNSEIITKQLAEIMININSGEGPLGRLIQDSTIAENINQTIANFKKSSEGLDETIEITKINVFEFMEKLQSMKRKNNYWFFVMPLLLLYVAKNRFNSACHFNCQQ